MQITRAAIRVLVESVLLEGFKDDQRYLIEKHPDHAADLGSLPPKWIAWLTARFGKNPARDEMHPFEDSIVTVVKFARLDAGLSTKYRASSKFRADVDEYMPPTARGWRDWSDPSQSVSLTVDQMETIMGLSERKKERFKSDVSEDEMESDRVGKVGPWNLWMPTTRERSCKIAQYDPVTREPKTTWCTARMAGSNLFYNYIGRPGADMTLFYIIKDNPSQNQDWLSVGFANGKPELSGQNGGISVDRSNVGLTPTKLKAALGPHHNEIMARLTQRNLELGGKHPAHQKIKDAAQNLESLRYLTTGLSEEEASDLKSVVLREPDVSLEVLRQLADDENKDVRRGARIVLSKNKRVPPEILRQLAQDEISTVRSEVARNPSTPAEILHVLGQDKNDITRESVASNPRTPAQILQQLAQDKDTFVVRSVARNPNTPAETLQMLANGESMPVKLGVANNPGAAATTLQQLAQDEDEFIRQVVSGNLSTPVEILRQLAQDEDKKVSDSAMNQLISRGLNESQLRQLIRQMI